MKNFLLLVCCFAAVSTFAQKKEKIKGSKNVITVTKEITEGFHSLEIDDGLDVDLRVSRLNTYNLEADDNLFGVIQFTVVDSVLKIHTTHKIGAHKKLNLELTTDGLRSITLRNKSSLQTKGRLSSSQLVFNAYDSCRFDLDAEALSVTVELRDNAGGELEIKSEDALITMKDRTDLKAEMSINDFDVSLENGAEIKLKGDAKDVNYTVKDRSHVKAKGFKATNAELYIDSSADIELTVSRNFELYAKNRSAIYLYGNPKIDVKGLSDRSKLIKKDQ